MWPLFQSFGFWTGFDKIKKEMFDQLSLRLARNIQDLKSTHQEFISLISIS